MQDTPFMDLTFGPIVAVRSSHLNHGLAMGSRSKKLGMQDYPFMDLTFGPDVAVRSSHLKHGLAKGSRSKKLGMQDTPFMDLTFGPKLEVRFAKLGGVFFELRMTSFCKKVVSIHSFVLRSWTIV